MGKAKSVFWLIIIGLIVVVFLQNQTFFMEKRSLLLVSYQTPETAIAFFFLSFFVLGLLMAYFLNLPQRFRLKKTIRNLKSTVDSQHREIEKLKMEPEPVQGNLPPGVPKKEQGSI